MGERWKGMWSLLWETKVRRPNIPDSPGDRPGGKRRAAAGEAHERLPTGRCTRIAVLVLPADPPRAPVSTQGQAPVPEVTRQKRQVVSHVVRSVLLVSLAGHVCLPAKEPGKGRCRDAGGGSALRCRHAPGPQRPLAAPTRRAESGTAERSEPMQDDHI